MINELEALGGTRVPGLDSLLRVGLCAPGGPRSLENQVCGSDDAPRTLFRESVHRAIGGSTSGWIHATRHLRPEAPRASCAYRQRRKKARSPDLMDTLLGGANVTAVCRKAQQVLTSIPRFRPNLLMTSSISLKAVVSPVQAQVSTNLSGEVVILCMRSGQYFSLDAVGARVWELLQQQRTLEEIRDLLIEEYEVDVERCTQDLLGLVAELSRAELVRVRGGEDTGSGEQ